MFAVLLRTLLFLICSTYLWSVSARPGAHENASRPIQIVMRHRYLSVARNGTVWGITNSTDSHSVFYRVPHYMNHLLKAAQTCRYICVNQCGYVYTAIVPNSECLWSTEIKETAYVMYKQFDSNTRAYLALNREGKPRNVLVNSSGVHRPLEPSSVKLTTLDWKHASITHKCVVSPNINEKLAYKPRKICDLDIRTLETTNDYVALKHSNVNATEGVNQTNFYSVENDFSIQLLPDSPKTSQRSYLEGQIQEILKEDSESQRAYPQTSSMLPLTVTVYNTNVYFHECVPAPLKMKTSKKNNV